MKRTLLFAGLAVAALSFVGCNKQEVDVAGNDSQVTVHFVMPETRTTNKGLSTIWADDDALTVFYAPAGTTDYSDNTEFAISSPEEGIAKADVTLESGSYDWYAFYPYSQYFTSPANNNDNPARTYIGSRSDGAQTQTGYNNMDHVAGPDVPLYGIVKGVPSSDDPEIQMKHIASLAEIVVTNNSGTAVTITGVDLSAPEDVDIVGYYNISFDAEPVITPYKTYQSNTAKLTVSDGTALANGASAKFYLVVKPFEADELTIKVTTDAGSQEKSKTLSSATFSAGHIKTLNFNFDKASGPAEVIAATVQEFLDAPVSTDQWYQLTGTVSNITSTTYGNFDLTDDTGTVYVYGLTKTKVEKNDKSFADLDVKAGDKVTIISLRSEHEGTPEAGGSVPAYLVSKEDGPTHSEIETKITIPYTANVYLGETFALNATANVDATITYESEDAAIASVDANGVITGVAEGSVKVYARIAGIPGQYSSDEKYCNVTVSIKPQETEGTVIFDQEFLAANQNGSKDVISYTNSSNYGSNTVTELRIYKGQEFTVSASGGKKITSIKITCTASGTAKYGPGSWGEGAPSGYTFDGTVGTWTGSASSVKFTATDNQVRIVNLVVTYE